MHADVQSLAELVWSHAPKGRRRAPRSLEDLPADDGRVDRALQGAEEARLSLRRPDDGLRGDAGLRARERPLGRLLGSGRRRRRTGGCGRREPSPVAAGALVQAGWSPAPARLRFAHFRARRTQRNMSRITTRPGHSYRMLTRALPSSWQMWTAGCARRTRSSCTSSPSGRPAPFWRWAPTAESQAS